MPWRLPARVAEDIASVEIDVHELAMLLEGIDVHRARTIGALGASDACITRRVIGPPQIPDRVC